MSRRKIWLICGAAVLVVGIGLSIVGYWVATQRVGDVRNGDAVPFTSIADPPAPADIHHARGAGLRAAVAVLRAHAVAHPRRNRYDDASIRRTRPAGQSRGGGLLEYPPTYADGVLYELSDAGTATAYNVFTGRVLWRQHLRAGSSLPALGSPAIGGKFVYMPAGSGLDALRRADGSLAWKLRTDSALEGSPAVWHGVVYLGKLSGAMVAVSAKTGHVLWTYATSGPVKHGPALVDGRLYFGDYAGVMYCLDATSGRLIWRTQTAGLLERVPIRWLLLDAGRRLRARVRRQHRRQGLLLRRDQRPGGVVDDAAGLGVRITGGRRWTRVRHLVAGRVRRSRTPAPESSCGAISCRTTPCPRRW